MAQKILQSIEKTPKKLWKFLKNRCSYLFKTSVDSKENSDEHKRNYRAYNEKYMLANGQNAWAFIIVNEPSIECPRFQYKTVYIKSERQMFVI